MRRGRQRAACAGRRQRRRVRARRPGRSPVPEDAPLGHHAVRREQVAASYLALQAWLGTAWRRSGCARSRTPIRVKRTRSCSGARRADRGRRARRHRCDRGLARSTPYGRDRTCETSWRAYRLLMQHGSAGRGLQRVYRRRRLRTRHRCCVWSRGRTDRCASRTDPAAPATGRGGPGWWRSTKPRAATGWSPGAHARRHPRRRPRRRPAPTSSCDAKTSRSRLLAVEASPRGLDRAGSWRRR